MPLAWSIARRSPALRAQGLGTRPKACQNVRAHWRLKCHKALTCHCAYLGYKYVHTNVIYNFCCFPAVLPNFRVGKFRHQHRWQASTTVAYQDCRVAADQLRMPTDSCPCVAATGTNAVVLCLVLLFVTQAYGTGPCPSGNARCKTGI
jgi:hypothetical protein